MQPSKNSREEGNAYKIETFSKCGNPDIAWKWWIVGTTHTHIVALEEGVEVDFYVTDRQGKKKILQGGDFIV